MLLPIALILLGIYWILAGLWIARMNGARRVRSWAFASTLCLLMFFADHIGGYLWFQWFTSSAFPLGPVTVVTTDLAVEEAVQDPQQRQEEVGQSLGGPPVFAAWMAAWHAMQPIRYSAASAGSIAADITTGLSRLELVNSRHSQIDSQGAPQIRSYWITQQPDPACKEFEAQSSERRAAQVHSLKVNGLEEPERYCIASAIVDHLTARYLERRRQASVAYPREWTWPALLGVYPTHVQFIDRRTGLVALEHKSAVFYGGWFLQFAKALPDADYTLSERAVSTRHLPAPCCKYLPASGLNLMPYVVGARPQSN